MNEKYIWELWSKCKHPHPEYGGGDMVWPMEFAELIIRECAKVADKGWAAPGIQIKQHFGIEE